MLYFDMAESRHLRLMQTVLAFVIYAAMVDRTSNPGKAPSVVIRMKEITPRYTT